MRLLVSALLAASVSFAAFAPAQACISACSGGGGGGSSTSSTPSSESGSSSESGDSNNHGISGAGENAIDVFIAQSVWNNQALNTLEEAIDRLRQIREARRDFANAIEALEANNYAGRSFVEVFLLHMAYNRRGSEAQATEDFIISRWGEQGLSAINDLT